MVSDSDQFVQISTRRRALDLPSSVYRALLEHMSEGVSLSAEDGTIVYTNPAEDRMFGYAPGELIGQHVSIQNAYSPAENAKIVAEVIAELKRTGAWRGEWFNRRKDGSTFITTSRITAVDVEGVPHWLCVQEDITGDRQAAVALTQSQARLELAASAAQLGIWDWDLLTNRFVYSARAREIYGFAPDQEISYELVRAVTHPDDLPNTSAQAQRALNPAIRENRPYEYRLVRADGAIRWVLAHGEATFAEVDGAVKAVRYVGTLQDVTERHQLEEAERAAAQRLRLALGASRIAVWEFDLKKDCLVDSPGLLRLLGFPEDSSPSTEEIRARYYPGERERIHALVQAALASGKPFFETDYRYIQPIGALRWLHLRCEIVLDNSGAPDRALGVVEDITDRKDAELRQAVLARISTETRDVDDPAEISYLAAQALGEALDVSRAGYGTIDTSAETITIERDWNAQGIQTLAGVLHFRDYGSYIEDLKRGETVVFANAEQDPRTASTAAALKAISAQAVVNMPVTEQGGFVALLYLNHATAREWSAAELALIREVADQTRVLVERRRVRHELEQLNKQLEKRVEQALAERRLFAEVVESTNAFVQVADTGFRWLAINRASALEFQRIFGVRPKVGDNMLDLLAHKPEHQAAVKAVWSRAFTGEQFIEVGEFGEPSRDRRFYEMRFSPLKARSGELIGAFQFVYDVTERVEQQRRLADAEAALVQSQKMEAMGKLTGGVAHDFNNLLTPIIGGLDMLQRRGVGDERARRMISGALASAERAQTLVQRLLAFARRQPLQPVAVDVAKLAAHMGELIESTTGPNIHVHVDVASDVPPARGDVNQLEMAILNLAVNARDAMPEGGRLTVSVREIVLESAKFGVKPGTYVCLAVTDTGVGMDEATLARAVEPFFSTKGIGKGTGLGLSMVHGLAAQLGGALNIRTQLGAGTSVELLLPVADREQLERSDAESSRNPQRAAGTVALVDDEELVRASTAEMLKELGYAVIEFASAEEASRELRNHQVDVVVTDHLMPGMSGADLARELRRRTPDLPVLIVSGYADVEGIAPDIPRLTKPFRQADLAASLSALIGTTSQTPALDRNV
jgi:PAS domain S-box-containing protein